MEAVHIVLDDSALGVEWVHDHELQAERLEQIQGTLRIPFICAGESLVNDYQSERVRIVVRADETILRGDGGGQNRKCELGFLPARLPGGG